MPKWSLILIAASLISLPALAEDADVFLHDILKICNMDTGSPAPKSCEPQSCEDVCKSDGIDESECPLYCNIST